MHQITEQNTSPTPALSRAVLLRRLLTGAYVALFVIPSYYFLHNRGGVSAIITGDFASTLGTLFPLLGLYAFTFTFIQVMLGTNMLRFRRVYGAKIYQFHRYQGLFTLLFATLHPLFILLAFGLSATFINHSFVDPKLLVWTIPAIIALILMYTTVITAVLYWRLQKLGGVWRWIHYLNYLVFILVWIHSTKIGSDTQSGFLQRLWLAYGVIALLSMADSIRRKTKLGRLQ